MKSEFARSYKELDVYYPYPDTAYGVLSWWDYGYWITRMAHRLPAANPGQDQRAIKDMAAFFTAQDEKTANKMIEKVDGGYKVKVGSVAHPMEDKHYIEWVELISGDTVQRQFLNPGEAPEATFITKAKDVSAREYCNLHGLWRA